MTANVRLMRPSQGSYLEGIYTPSETPKDKLVVLSSSFCSHKDQYPVYSKFAAEASRAGYDVLRFDFTGLGQSSGRYEDTTISSQIKDLSDMVREFSRGREVCLVGHSMGGIVSTNVAPSNSNVKTVVLWSSPMNMKIYHEAYAAEVQDKGYTIRKRNGKEIKVGRAMWQEFATIEHDAKTFAKMPVRIVAGTEDDVANWVDYKFKYPSHVNINSGTIIGGDHNLEQPGVAEEAISLTIDWMNRNL